MIQINQLSKSFGPIRALQGIHLTIPEGEVFGLVGTNGAGKSTLLRLLTGILRPEQGEVLVDGAPVYENPSVKSRLFYASDDAWFLPNASPDEMASFLSICYPEFDHPRFSALLQDFGLDPNRNIQTFSKGMKKQLSIILGLCARTRYLLCDETFDGLDPVMRQAVKSLIAGEMLARSFTPVIASHNLRELEDICDRVGLLHEGGVLLTRDLEDMKLHIHKVQCLLPSPQALEQLQDSLDIVSQQCQGSLVLLTCRGMRQEILRKVAAVHPSFFEIIPLSLEEIFISETEVAGYEVRNLFH